jgi:hypothetical protein
MTTSLGRLAEPASTAGLAFGDAAGIWALLSDDVNDISVEKKIVMNATR